MVDTGAQVASAQSAGTGRQFEFETASLGNIESIEVTKAPTPDMDGASIGGRSRDGVPQDLVADFLRIDPRGLALRRRGERPPGRARPAASPLAGAAGVSGT